MQGRCFTRSIRDQHPDNLSGLSGCYIFMLVDIVIPIGPGRPELAGQTIKSLYENTPNEDFNLWAYLDGADPETSRIVRGFNEGIFQLRVNSKSCGPGFCRNAICKWITEGEGGGRAKFLYHSDSDVYFMKGWLDALIETHEAFPQVKLFGAGCHPYLHTNQKLEKDGIVVHTKDAIPGFTAFMDWETWDKYGPYDEHKGIMGSEDWKFCQDIIKDGNFVASIVPEKVIHCGKTNSNGKLATGHELMEGVPGRSDIKIL